VLGICTSSDPGPGVDEGARLAEAPLDTKVYFSKPDGMLDYRRQCGFAKPEAFGWPW